MKEASPPIIIITGFMGAGKTTTANALARKLCCKMIDLDGLIEDIAGRKPQVIIDEDGEPGFREIEAGALRSALETTEARIIALGGGTWTIAPNRTLIKEHQALTIWLDAPFELCWQRIASENNLRPLARDRKRARRLYDERRPLYHQARVHVAVSEERNADDIAAEIAEALKRETKEQTEQGKL